MVPNFFIMQNFTAISLCLLAESNLRYIVIARWWFSSWVTQPIFYPVCRANRLSSKATDVWVHSQVTAMSSQSVHSWSCLPVLSLKPLTATLWLQSLHHCQAGVAGRDVLLNVDSSRGDIAVANRSWYLLPWRQFPLASSGITDAGLNLLELSS